MYFYFVRHSNFQTVQCSSHGGFEWIFLSFGKCRILTPDIRKQPQTSLESFLKAVWGSTMNDYYRELHVHVHKTDQCNSWWPPLQFLLLLHIYQNVDGFRQTSHKAFRVYRTLEQNRKPIRFFFLFKTVYFKWYSGIYIHVYIYIHYNQLHICIHVHVHVHVPRIKLKIAIL